MKQKLFKFENNPDFSENNFFVSESNRDVFEWIKKWPTWPSHCLFLYGTEHSGKSHLAYIWSKISDACFLEPDFNINNIEKGKNYIIDNAEKFKEKKLFHLFNSVKENTGYFLITSRKSSFDLKDLDSRIKSSIYVSIKEPDDELIKTLLVKMFSDRQIRIDREVVDFSVSRIGRSFLDIKNFIEDVDSFSFLEKRNITIPLIKKVLERQKDQSVLKIFQQ